MVIKPSVAARYRILTADWFDGDNFQPAFPQSIDDLLQLIRCKTRRFQLLNECGVSVGIRSNVATMVATFLKRLGNAVFFGFN